MQKFIRPHTHPGLKFCLPPLPPQAVRSRQGGAAEHGRRRLSDVARDDGQSQSGAGGGPGTGGRELVRGPGVTGVPAPRSPPLTQTSCET